MRHISLAIALTAFLLGTPAAGDVHDDYQSGIEAFNSQHFDLAAVHFEQARAGGMEKPTLYYNLGVVYFKLERYSDSKANFEQITEDDQWGALALYNLGLVNDAMGDTVDAQIHYQRAYNTSESPKLQALARNKIVNQETASDVPLHESWSGFFSSGLGYDDNVVLVDAGTVEEVSDKDDFFAEVFGATNRYITGNYDRGWRAELGGYYRFHRELDEFDFGVGSLGLAYAQLAGFWHLQAGGSAYFRSAGGSSFTNSGVLTLSAYRPMENGLAFLGTFEGHRIKGSDNYEYLTGSASRTTIELNKRTHRTRYRFGYQLELNDRRDLEFEDEFFSYSPTRHRIFVRFERNLTQKFEGQLGFVFRSSDYGEENTQINPDGSVTEKVRKEDRITLAARLGYDISSSWHLFAEYEYTDNDSNFDQYSYKGSRLMIGFEADF